MMEYPIIQDFIIILCLGSTESDIDISELCYDEVSYNRNSKIIIFMPPTSKKLRGHIGLGLSVQCSE